jgi:hypothetical protein
MSEQTISRVELQRMSNDAHFQFHTETAALAAASDAAALHIEGLDSRHAAQLATLDEALKKIVKSPITAQIHEADKKRDDAYRGLAAFNKAMLLHSDPAIRAAAEHIQIVIDTYGNVVSRSYEEESSAVYNLVQDLMSLKYAPDAATAGLTQWVTKLGAANNTVSALIANRDAETAAKTHVVVKDARRDIDRTFRKIAARVNSHAGEDATPAVSEFIMKLNIIIKRFATLVKQHHSHHHHNGNGGNGGGG